VEIAELKQAESLERLRKPRQDDAVFDKPNVQEISVCQRTQARCPEARRHDGIPSANAAQPVPPFAIFDEEKPLLPGEPPFEDVRSQPYAQALPVLIRELLVNHFRQANTGAPLPETENAALRIGEK
jgi:hypothetical protein